MKYEDFLKIIMTDKKFNSEISELYDIGFDFLEGKYKLSDLFGSVVETALRQSYDDDGMEWVYWFIYDNEYGQKDWGIKDNKPVYGATNEKGEPICHSYESLWKYLEENHKHKKK